MKAGRRKLIWVFAALVAIGVGVGWWLWPRQGVVITFVGIGAAPDERFEGQYAIFSVENRLGGRMHFNDHPLQYRARRGDGWETQVNLMGFAHRTLAEADAGIDHGGRKLLYARMDPDGRSRITGPFQIGLDVFEPPGAITMFLPEPVLSLLPDSVGARKWRTYWSETVTP